MDLRHDPVEDTLKYRQIECELEERLASFIDELKKESSEINSRIGVCPSVSHRVWQKKKEILLSEYGIEWKTPYEMNPDVNFY